MQSKERGKSRVMSFAARKKLYPGNSGYSQNTGGSLKNLRSSTSNEKVRKYHEEFYRPENLVINVIGHIDPEEIFEVLIEVEQKILDKRSENPATKYERPWQKEIEKFMTLLLGKYQMIGTNTGIVLLDWYFPPKIYYGLHAFWFALLGSYGPPIYFKLPISTLYLLKWLI